MDLETLHEKFEKVNENERIERWENSVDTPTDSDSGYDVKETTQVAYVEDDYIALVRCVGSLGWSLSEYEDGEILETGGPYYDYEAPVHEDAKEAVL